MRTRTQSGSTTLQASSDEQRTGHPPTKTTNAGSAILYLTRSEPASRRSQGLNFDSVSANVTSESRRGQVLDCVLLTPRRQSTPFSRTRPSSECRPTRLARSRVGPSSASAVSANKSLASKANRTLNATKVRDAITPSQLAFTDKRKRDKDPQKPSLAISAPPSGKKTEFRRSESGLPTPVSSPGSVDMVNDWAQETASPVGRAAVDKGKEVAANGDDAVQPRSSKRRKVQESTPPATSPVTTELVRPLPTTGSITPASQTATVTEHIDFQLLDILQTATLPWQPTSLEYASDNTTGTYDEAIYLPPGMSYIIETMRSALQQERSARLKTETRYEREVGMRAAAEERLRQEVETHLDAQCEAQRTIERLQTQVWELNMKQMNFNEAVAQLLGATLDSTFKEAFNRLFGRVNPVEEVPTSSTVSSWATLMDDGREEQSAADYKGKGRMVELDI
ncbi:hypothetical protein BC835DRAFT_1303431 [Cytidiella melzeri]|nr:hypothetical protein BC835DRAFT_1303431 [Cytidiella melzeri]